MLGLFGEAAVNSPLHSNTSVHAATLGPSPPDEVVMMWDRQPERHDTAMRSGGDMRASFGRVPDSPASSTTPRGLQHQESPSLPLLRRRQAVTAHPNPRLKASVARRKKAISTLGNDVVPTKDDMPIARTVSGRRTGMFRFGDNTGAKHHGRDVQALRQTSLKRPDSVASMGRSINREMATRRRRGMRELSRNRTSSTAGVGRAGSRRVSGGGGRASASASAVMNSNDKAIGEQEHSVKRLVAIALRYGVLAVGRQGAAVTSWL